MLERTRAGDRFFLSHKPKNSIGHQETWDKSSCEFATIARTGQPTLAVCSLAPSVQYEENEGGADKHLDRKPFFVLRGKAVS